MHFLQFLQNFFAAQLFISLLVQGLLLVSFALEITIERLIDLQKIVIYLILIILLFVSHTGLDKLSDIADVFKFFPWFSIEKGLRHGDIGPVFILSELDLIGFDFFEVVLIKGFPLDMKGSFIILGNVSLMILISVVNCITSGKHLMSLFLYRYQSYIEFRRLILLIII